MSHTYETHPAQYYATFPAVSYSPYDNDSDVESEDDGEASPQQQEQPPPPPPPRQRQQPQQQPGAGGDGSEGVGDGGDDTPTHGDEDGDGDGDEEVKDGETPMYGDGDDSESEADADEIPSSRIEFHSQEHAYIQQTFPKVPDDLVNLIREYSQVTLEGEVTTAETKYAMFAAKRRQDLAQPAFFVFFGFLLTLISAVLFFIDVYPGNERWYWPALVIPAVMSLVGASSTADIWNLHVRTKKCLIGFRVVCWAALVIQLVATMQPPSVFFFIPLLLESIAALLQCTREFVFSPKPPLAMVHISTELHAVTFWTLDSDFDPSADVPEYPPPQNFKLAGWYPLREFQLTLYTAPDVMWHMYSVAKLECHNPGNYGNVRAKEHVSMFVLVPRELQNLLLFKHEDFVSCFTLKTEYGGLHSGARRPVLLTDMHRDHILDREGFFSNV